MGLVGSALMTALSSLIYKFQSGERTRLAAERIPGASNRVK